MVHGVQPLGGHQIYPPVIRRQSRNHWLNGAFLAQRVRSDQHERACPAITSISHAAGHWFDPSRHHPPSICPSGRLCHSAMSTSTVSVIRLIGCFDTVALYTSSTCGDLTGGQT